LQLKSIRRDLVLRPLAIISGIVNARPLRSYSFNFDIEVLVNRSWCNDQRRFIPGMQSLRALESSHLAGSITLLARRLTLSRVPDIAFFGAKLPYGRNTP
jgi:hypothetical protein